MLVGDENLSQVENMQTKFYKQKSLNHPFKSSHKPYFTNQISICVKGSYVLDLIEQSSSLKLSDMWVSQKLVNLSLIYGHY